MSKINRLSMSNQSSDMNPIENVWANLVPQISGMSTRLPIKEGFFQVLNRA